ncbi:MULTISPECIES: hypothetical protein [Gordonia]|jgi:hypothetical protein|nr:MULTISPECIES: hypothetical protein [Gordonia]
MSAGDAGTRNGVVGVGHPLRGDVGEMSVNDMIAATPLGPILDRPVNDILSGLSLPTLPRVPEIPPLPGLPVLPTLDLTALLKPLTDLLGGFGTGNLATAAIDPSKLFTALSGALDSAVSTSSGALKVAAQIWDGQASQAALIKNVKVGADTTAVSRQGATMSIDIQAAATIVGTGLTQVQGIIAATVSKIGATLPVIGTPAGQGLALGFAAEGLAQAIAVVTATRAQLLGPTAHMSTNGLKIKVTNVPRVNGVNPFSVAGSALDAVTPVVSAAKQIPTELTTRTTPDPVKTVPTTTTQTTTTTTKADRLLTATQNDPPVRSAAAGPGTIGHPSSAQLSANAPGLPTGGPASQTPAGTYRPTMPTGGAEPAVGPGVRTLAGSSTYGPGAPMAATPVGGAARGGGDGAHGSAAYLVNEDNGRRVVGETGPAVPAVFGDDDRVPAERAPAPDIALRLNLSLSADIGRS